MCGKRMRKKVECGRCMCCARQTDTDTAEMEGASQHRMHTCTPLRAFPGAREHQVECVRAAGRGERGKRRPQFNACMPLPPSCPRENRFPARQQAALGSRRYVCPNYSRGYEIQAVQDDGKNNYLSKLECGRLYR